MRREPTACPKQQVRRRPWSPHPDSDTPQTSTHGDKGGKRASVCQARDVCSGDTQERKHSPHTYLQTASRRRTGNQKWLMRASLLLPARNKDPWAEDKRAGGCGCKHGPGSRSGVRGDSSGAAIKGQRKTLERFTEGLHWRQNSTEVKWSRAVPSPYSSMSCAPDQQSQGAESQAQLQTQSQDVIFKVSCCLGLALRFDNH